MSCLWWTEATAKNIAHIPNITLIGNAVTWNIKWRQKIFWTYNLDITAIKGAYTKNIIAVPDMMD
jgi:hypothetical protein